MQIIGLKAEGLAFFSQMDTGDPLRTVEIGGSQECIVAFLDTMDLLFAALDPERLRSVLLGLGFADSPADLQVLGEPLPEQATWTHADGPRSLLYPPGQRSIRIEANLALDAPQFGRLREEALRDPSLVDALGKGPRVTLGVGYLFNAALNAVSVSLLSLRVGGEAVSITGERPAWVLPFVRDLALRHRRMPERHVDGPVLRKAAIAWMDAILSADPRKHRAAGALAATLEAPPFGLAHARPVRWNGDGVEVLVAPSGESDGPFVPIRRLGPAAAEALEIAAEIHLSGAEILACGWPGSTVPDPGARRSWLAAMAEGSGPLEQVFLCGGSGGTLTLRWNPPQPPTPPRTRSMPFRPVLT